MEPKIDPDIINEIMWADDEDFEREVKDLDLRVSFHITLMQLFSYYLHRWQHY